MKVHMKKIVSKVCITIITLNAYCSDQALVDSGGSGALLRQGFEGPSAGDASTQGVASAVGLSRSRGTKRKSSDKASTIAGKKQKSIPQEAIMQYKNLRCINTQNQKTFFDACLKEGWKGKLSDITYNVPEGYDYCPLRANGCPRIIAKLGKGQLASHMKAHHRVEYDADLKAKGINYVSGSPLPFVCPQCSTGCKAMAYLTIHMRGHTGEKPFECSTCKKRFPYKGNLNKHMKIHAKSKYRRALESPVAHSAQQDAALASGVPEYPFAVPQIYHDEPESASKGPIRGDDLMLPMADDQDGVI